MYNEYISSTINKYANYLWQARYPNLDHESVKDIIQDSVERYLVSEKKGLNNRSIKSEEDAISYIIQFINRSMKLKVSEKSTLSSIESSDLIADSETDFLVSDAMSHIPLELEISFPDKFSEEEISKFFSRLSTKLDDFYRSAGGSGLKVDGIESAILEDIKIPV